MRCWKVAWIQEVKHSLNPCWAPHLPKLLSFLPRQVRQTHSRPHQEPEPTEMREKIAQLLAACHSQKDKYSTVEKQYLNLLYKDFENPNSHFHCTSRRFIQLFERHLHRKIEENTAINATREQTRLVEQITESLANSGQVPDQVVTPSISQVTEILPPPLKRSIDATQLDKQLL